MSAPFLFGAGALFFASSGTSIAPVLPANDANNDIGVMVAWCTNNSTFSTPTNWNPLGTTVSSTNMSAAVFWKRLTGSDVNPTSTTSATGSGTIGLFGRIYVFRGCLTSATPFENTANAGTPTSSTTPATSSVTTTAAQRLVVSIAMVDDDNTWVNGHPPTGWELLSDRGVNSAGGGGMVSAIGRVEASATTVASVNIGTMNAADFWRTISFALIPEPGQPTPGVATGSFGFTGFVDGLRLPTPRGPESRSPIACLLMVNTPANWNVHPYYPVTVSPANWGNQTDMDAIDAALTTTLPQRTKTIIIAEDNGTADGRCVAALNWALRNYDEVMSVHLRSPIIDLEERHTRVGGGEATSIAAAYIPSGQRLNLNGTNGNYASTPDTGVLDITGSIDIRVELQVPDWNNGVQQSIISKWNGTGNQRSYRMWIATNGLLGFGWTTNGTTQNNITSTESAMRVFGAGKGVVRATMNNSTGDVTFYTSNSRTGPWTQLGSVIAGSGATSIFVSTAVLEVGGVNSGTTQMMTGQVYWAEVLDGIDGTVVANPDFNAETGGTTSFSDAAGRAWTVNGSAAIGVGDYTYMMSEWNPAFLHRKEMAAHLLNRKLHIWRDDADSVTPIAVTDAIAATMRANLHTTVGTEATIVPTGLSWDQKPAYTEMKKMHDFSYNTPAFTGYKMGDGGMTLVVPDGRWVSFFGDTLRGHIHKQMSLNFMGLVRNSAIVYNSLGEPEDQIWSGAPGTAAYEPNQTEFPTQWYWPITCATVNGIPYLMMNQREPGGLLGVTVDMVILTLDPTTLQPTATTSLGELNDFEVHGFVPDSDTGFVYIPSGTPEPGAFPWRPITIARAPINQLTDISQWRFWDGTGWNVDPGTRVGLRENVPASLGGGTKEIVSDSFRDYVAMRRYGTGFLLCVQGIGSPWLAIYYSTQPQGPWTHYKNIPLWETGGTRYGGQVYGYVPQWQPMRDPTMTDLMVSFNAIILEGIYPSEEMDYLFGVMHFAVVPIDRDLF